MILERPPAGSAVLALGLRITGVVAALLSDVIDDVWPEWAKRRLVAAVDLAAAAPPRRSLAAELYERWYAPPAADLPTPPPRALAGQFRRAHAGSGRWYTADDVRVVERFDVIGRDGWWRTWNESWPRHRARSRGVRLLLSPEARTAADVVALLTGALADVPHCLAVATEPGRLARSGAAVLALPELAALESVRPTLERLLRDDVPALCLPLGQGIAAAQLPDNGMTFGEHRCHLVALALRRHSADPLARIARIFDRNGVDPAAPHLSKAD